MVLLRDYFSRQRNLTLVTSNELTQITGCVPPCSYYEYSKVDSVKTSLGVGRYPIINIKAADLIIL